MARPKKPPLKVIYDPKVASELDRTSIMSRLKRAARVSKLRTNHEGPPPTNSSR